MIEKKEKFDTLFPWIGNKKFYIDIIKSHLPKNWCIEKNNYIEPFLGSAVVFMALSPPSAILSDKSTYLVDIFRCMKTNPKYFYKKINWFYENNSKQLHEWSKTKICSTKSIYLRSAMFWYLLRTSLYSFVCPKVDSKSFTCCYKSTEKPLKNKDIVLFAFGEQNSEHIRKADVLILYWALANALRSPHVQLYSEDFSSILSRAKTGDFVFIDPPYMNSKRPSRKIYSSFTTKDHERLVENILTLHEKGCFIMMFNHDHPYLLEKLKNFTAIKIDHHKIRKSKSQFATYEEVLFINYDKV